MIRIALPNGATDVGLIDAALLQNDFVGNFLPFDAARLVRILLTRAEPDAVGMSPIGGFIDPVGAADDCGLLVEMGPGRSFLRRRCRRAVSRGIRQRAFTRRVTYARLNSADPPCSRSTATAISNSKSDQTATLTITRDGPWLFDIAAAMRHAVAPRYDRLTPSRAMAITLRAATIDDVPSLLDVLARIRRRSSRHVGRRRGSRRPQRFAH